MSVHMFILYRVRVKVNTKLHSPYIKFNTFISDFIRFISNDLHLISIYVLPGIYVLHQLVTDALFQRRNSSLPSLDL